MENANRKIVNIIGGGLAGSEAAYFLLKKGYEVHLYERRPHYDDHAHTTALFGELVCSNSLKSSKLDNACGLLKEEIKNMGSIMMEAAEVSSVPAGAALSVDRDLFAENITAKLRSFPNLVIHEEEVVELFDTPTILATGPLTDGKLMEVLSKTIGEKSLSFFDASAPIVRKDSIDFSKAYFKSRFEQGDAAYINCPFTRPEYELFVRELVGAEKAMLHSFDTKYFEACLPVEVIASRGIETLRHGPLKPFGLGNEDHPKPYAVVQLRQDTKLGDYFNLVGFQTNLTYPEQKRVFSMIPGLENAVFVRYGLMHRNSYINSPLVLNEDLTLKAKPNVYVAGQLNGVEGYVESAAMGLLAAINLYLKMEGRKQIELSKNTILGALNDYILHATGSHFQPMNANWALIPNSKKDNREETIQASLGAIKEYWAKVNE
ncbi:MAG: methylenetetrahydrofolate--tRNA-(uracil(54)-C(5))-methyltransferase (FADH(2)-oxidizing) TrmFO [Bacilli bacterium]|nr:methylenetetrahydrofolate--tRNA-(uracil(54)-C(5))-methyltransferase (FADH(2)-oxidizing) TrmFO [Bacilli bacterium]